MFFGSGAASLMLQVVWFKQLQFILGSSTNAVSITIASFFLGLALGAWFGGRVADKTDNLLRTYAVIECVVGLLAIGTTALLANWATWIGPLLPLLAAGSATQTPMFIVIGAATLLAPTTLMGATLPFLARFVVSAPDAIANRVGLLYGINTLGAVVGSLFVGFFLIGWVGVTTSAWIAASLYLFIGAMAFLLSRATPHHSHRTETGEEPKKEAYFFLVWVFAVSGFVAIAYEVIWFRMLSTVTARSVYTFSSILAVYLFGLVAGSFLCARFLAPKKDQLLASFVRIQILIGLTAILSLAVMGKIGFFSQLVLTVVTTILPAGLLHAFGVEVHLTLLCLAVFGVPTTLIGIAFPLASELTIERVGVVGSKLGKLYALNTLGGVFGSLAAGFVLLPLIGSQWAVTLMVALNLTLAAIVVWKSELRRTVLRREVIIGAVAVIAILVTLGPGYLRAQLSAYDGGEVVELRESKDATYVVIQYGEGETRFTQLLANGTSYANNSPDGRRYMAALTHLPMLLHADPKTAVVICIGTGTTVGALTTYDQLSQITAVDLSSEVFGFAPHFVPINESFHLNPRVDQVVADGRHFLLSTDRTFDVLTFEPPPPEDAGVVNLYSEEFYDIAKMRMNKNGIVAQWVPMTMSRGELPKVILRSMLNRFEHVSFWVTNHMEGIALASDAPLVIDEEVLRQRMQEPRVHASLAAVGMETPEDFLGTFIASDDALEKWVADVPTVTDDRPTLEHHRGFEQAVLGVDELVAIRESVAKHMVHPPSSPDAMRAASDAVIATNRVYGAKLQAKRLHAQRALELRPTNQFYRWQIDSVSKQRDVDENE